MQMRSYNREICESGNRRKYVVNAFGCLMVILTQAGITLYLPSFPAIQQTFHTTHHAVALSLTFYMLGYALSMLVWGPLSDYIGRKHGLLVALTLFIVTSVGLAITNSILFFMLLRFLQGAGGGGCAVIGRTAIRDVFEREALVKAMSYVSIAFIVALGVFQVLGGHIQNFYQWQDEFWLMGIIGFIALLLIILFFPETTVRSMPLIAFKKYKYFLKDYFNIIKNKNFLLAAIGGGIGYGITISFHVISPFLLQEELHLTPMQYGYLGLIISASYLLGTVITNRFVVKFGINRLIQGGIFTIISVGIIMYSLAVFNVFNVYAIMVPLFFVTIGQALIYPCAMALALQSYKEQAGYATGLFGFIQQSLASCAAYIAAYLPHKTQLSFTLVIIAIGIVGLVCFFKELYLTAN